jgi:hypothetical protein
MKKKFFILASLLVLVLITFLVISCSNHKKLLEERLEIKMPKSTEICEYSNNANISAGVCAAKISIADSDYDEIIAQLGTYHLEEDLSNKGHEENIINWWDLNNDDIEFWYSSLLSPNHFILGPKPKTAEQDIYITYSVNGKRTIYLVYVE